MGSIIAYIISGCSVLIAFGGICLSFKSVKRNVNNDIREEAAMDAEIKAGIKQLGEKMDDMIASQDKISDSVEKLTNRITNVEKDLVRIDAKAEAAHERLDLYIGTSRLKIKKQIEAAQGTI